MTEPCPVCGEPMKVKRWYENGWLVEIVATCPCGYKYHWAYGSVVEDGKDGDE